MKASENSTRCKKNSARLACCLRGDDRRSSKPMPRSPFGTWTLRPARRRFKQTVCNACQAYARLVELGKTDVAYPQRVWPGSAFPRRGKAGRSAAS